MPAGSPIVPAVLLRSYEAKGTILVGRGARDPVAITPLPGDDGKVLVATSEAESGWALESPTSSSGLPYSIVVDYVDLLAGGLKEEPFSGLTFNGNPIANGSLVLILLPTTETLRGVWVARSGAWERYTIDGEQVLRPGLIINVAGDDAPYATFVVMNKTLVVGTDVPVIVGLGRSASFTVSALWGDAQSAEVEEPFLVGLVVRVLDVNGSPFPGVNVTFAVPEEGASCTLSAYTARTDAGGQVVVTATANATAGSYVVTANVATLESQAEFNLTNTPQGTEDPEDLGATNWWDMDQLDPGNTGNWTEWTDRIGSETLVPAGGGSGGTMAAPFLFNGKRCAAQGGTGIGFTCSAQLNSAVFSVFIGVGVDGTGNTGVMAPFWCNSQAFRLTPTNGTNASPVNVNADTDDAPLVRDICQSTTGGTTTGAFIVTWSPSLGVDVYSWHSEALDGWVQVTPDVLDQVQSSLGETLADTAGLTLMVMADADLAPAFGGQGSGLGDTALFSRVLDATDRDKLLVWWKEKLGV